MAKKKKKVAKKRAVARKTVAKSAEKASVSAVKSKSIGIGLAVIALILNILILPGFGSLIAGRTKTGIWQVVLFIAGAILSLIFYLSGGDFTYALIGSPLLLAAWLWGLVTGVRLIQGY